MAIANRHRHTGAEKERDDIELGLVEKKEDKETKTEVKKK